MKQYMIVKGEYFGEGGSERPFYSSVWDVEELRNNDWLSEKQKSRFTHVLEAQPVIELLDKVEGLLNNGQLIYASYLIKEFKEKIK